MTRIEGTYSAGNAANIHFRVRNAAGQWLLSAGTFEAFDASHLSSYQIAATEYGATGVYYADVPDGAADYELLVTATGVRVGVGDARVALLDLPVSEAGDPTAIAAAVAPAVWSYGNRTTTIGDPVAVPAQQYRQRRIVRGNSYGQDSRAFLITRVPGAEWPTDLSEYTWTFAATKDADNANAGSDAIAGTAEAVTATGDDRYLRVSLTAAATAGAALGLYDYTIRGTLTGSDPAEVWTVELGTLDVAPDPAQA